MNATLVYKVNEAPQPSDVADKKALASKITSREFIEMPKSEIQPPPGYRNAVIANKYNYNTTYTEKNKNAKVDEKVKSRTTKASATQKKTIKQVSEVDSTAKL